MSRFLKSLSVFFAMSSLIFPASASQPIPESITIRILAINDFHGQITTGRTLNGKPVGSAGVMAAYLKQAASGQEGHTLIALQGDMMGASPAASGLLRHEPTIAFFNSLANADCKTTHRFDPHCNMVATAGNHEFDNGLPAFLRLLEGSTGSPARHWIDKNRYQGARFPVISANIVDKRDNRLVFPPYVVKDIQGVRVAFIGAITKDAASNILADNTRDIRFTDEAEAINRYIPEVKAKGADIVVVSIHEGGTQGASQKISGPIARIAARLDQGVDVILAGHSHTFLNGSVQDRHGKDILIVEAGSYGEGFANVVLTFDPQSRTLRKKSAGVVITRADIPPGNTPDPEAEALTRLAERAVLPVVTKPVAILADNFPQDSHVIGETALGNLIARALRTGMNADLGIIQQGGIRASLKQGTVTYGDVQAVTPFTDPVVKLAMRGRDIRALLEQQWTNPHPSVLHLDGLRYRYDPKMPAGKHVSNLVHDNTLLQDNRLYTVAMSSFLASGGDGFSVMRHAKLLETGATSATLLRRFLSHSPGPVTAVMDGRIAEVSHTLSLGDGAFSAHRLSENRAHRKGCKHPEACTNGHGKRG